MQATVLIGLTCFLLISVVQTAEAKWKHIDSSHGALCEVDPKSIEKTPQIFRLPQPISKNQPKKLFQDVNILARLLARPRWEATLLFFIILVRTRR